MKRVVSISRAETTMLRAQTTTTCTAGIPTRPGSLYPVLVPGTKCYKWTKPDALQFKRKNDHSRAISPGGKIHTIFLFFRLNVHNMWCYFYGLGHKMTGCFFWKWLWVCSRVEHGSGPDRTGSGLKPILAGSW